MDHTFIKLCADCIFTLYPRGTDIDVFMICGAPVTMPGECSHCGQHMTLAMVSEKQLESMKETR